MLPVIIPIIAAVTTAYILKTCWDRYRRHVAREEMKKLYGAQPPAKYPHKDPILGIDLVLTEDRAVENDIYLKSLEDRFRRFGNTVHENLLGWWVLMTNEPQNIQAILSTKFEDWRFGFLRDAAFKPLMGDAIFTMEGKDWDHSRAFLRPQFVRQQYGSAEMFEQHVENLFKAIPRTGETVDLQKLFFNYTLDAATDFLFGQPVNALLPEKESKGSELAVAFYEAQYMCSERLRTGPLALLPASRSYLRACKRCHRWIDGHVSQALANHHRSSHLQKAPIDSGHNGGDTKERFILLEEVVKETSDPIRIRSEMISILIAGRDTTASALSSLWFVLARRPDVVEKLRAEINELEGQKPTFERLKKMKYLQWTIHEALRLYPPVPLNLREAKVDTILPVGGGPDGRAPVFVPRGQTVFYVVGAMHKRKDIWGLDAGEFNPERWENRKTGWEFLPFNGGPRICLGQQFALTEIAYTTVRLLQEFSEIENRDDSDWVELMTLTCAVKNGCQVALTPR